MRLNAKRRSKKRPCCDQELPASDSAHSILPCELARKVYASAVQRESILPRYPDASYSHRKRGPYLAFKVRRAGIGSYSITLSARRTMDCGIWIPRALAVLRLITNSNLLGNSTGRSAGLAPLSIL